MVLTVVFFCLIATIECLRLKKIDKYPCLKFQLTNWLANKYLNNWADIKKCAGLLFSCTRNSQSHILSPLA